MPCPCVLAPLAAAGADCRLAFADLLSDTSLVRVARAVCFAVEPRQSASTANMSCLQIVCVFVSGRR
jgi:hypothetical protein